MSKKTITEIPRIGIVAVILACLAGIGIGSFYDYPISVALANRTTLGSIFADASPVAAYCLIPAGWVCIYTGLKKKAASFRIPVWLVLLLAGIVAVCLSDWYYGGIVHLVLGYILGQSFAYLNAAEWLFWIAAYAVFPILLSRFLDDSDPNRLIALGIALWIATVASDMAVQWLKQMASRPRYKYLLTLGDPLSEYRDWWQMIPYMAGSNENYQSWPSGHMSIVGVLFALPLLTDCMKKRSDRRNTAVFAGVCVYIVLCGYNRIHMTNHFLTDVCFGTLESFLITIVTCTIAMHIVKAKGSSIAEGDHEEV